VKPPSGEQFELSHGDQRATVVEVGGGLRAYSLGDRQLIDGYGEHEMCRSGRGQVLAPWPNRLEDGRYDFEGRSHQLSLSEPATRTAIHGLVRWTSWDPVTLEADRAVLEHQLRPQPGYPFMLRMRVEYKLGETGLAVRTTATNNGGEPCPFGIGFHPYLTVGTPVVDTAILAVPARTVLRSNERGIPEGVGSVDGSAYDFRQPRPIGNTVLDNAFTDLERDQDGLARVHLRDPEGSSELTLWADDAFRYVMVFSGDPLPDVARRSVAVEPMTCPPNAFRTGDGVVRLEPGGAFTCAWGLSPEG
jgi:aldose 1-epimerase